MHIARPLNFLKSDLSKCSLSVKESAYLAILHPWLEYASVVWDPYHNNKIEHLEKVQRRAARWVVNNFSCHSSGYNNVATSSMANPTIVLKNI